MIHQERIKMKETLEKGPAPLITGLTLPIPYAELRNILKNESGSDGVPKSKTKAQTDDLLRVIEHLSKNVNEQKEEIDNLRRVAPSNLKFMEIVKENKRLKKAYDEVDEQVKKHTSSAAQLER